MQRALSNDEQAAIEQQVIAKIKQEKPDITADEAGPIYDQMMAAAIKTAQSVPPMASGGPVKRMISGVWDGTLGGMVDTVKAVPAMVKDIIPNIERELTAAGQTLLPSSTDKDFWGHVGAALPIIGPMARGVGTLSGTRANQAVADVQAGNYGDAATNLAGSVPIIGADVPHIVDRFKSGDWAGAGGETLGQIASLVIPEKLAKVKVPGFLSGANSERAALMRREFARGNDIDLATASGNPTIAVMQKVGGEGVFGSVPTAIVTGRAEARDALKAQRLAGEASGMTMQGPLQKGQTSRNVPVTPYEGGSRPVDLVTESRDKAFAAGSEAYDTAEMKAAMSDPEWVKKVQDFSERQQAKAESSLGRQVKPEEVPELRRILQEMEAMPYTENIWSPTEGRDAGNTASRQWNVTGGGGGAKVFNSIVEKIPMRQWVDPVSGLVKDVAADPSRAEVIISLKRALATGNFTGPAKAAMEVVAERMANPIGKAARAAELPPGAGDILKEVQLPVDRVPAQDLLRRSYEQGLKDIEELNIPAGPAMKRLQGFMRTTEPISFMDLENVLSEFKRISRGGEKVLNAAARPDFDQALARQAIAAIEPILQEKGATVPGLMDALEQGRAHWKEGFRLDDIRDTLTKHAAADTRFNALTGAASTEMLQELQKGRPDAIGIVAKAKLDELNTMGPTKAWAEFQKIPKESLKILFPDPGHAAALSDLYQRLALRAENVNPSRSFLSATKWGEVTSLGGALASALTGNTLPGSSTFAIAAPVWFVLQGAMGVAAHSTKVTKLLAQGVNIPLRDTAAITALARQLSVAMQEDNQANTGRRDVELPAQKGRDPRLPPP